MASGFACRECCASGGKLVRDQARDDAVCRRLMTVPGVGAIVALSYVAAVDDPARFAKSRAVGPALGLTPSRYQSGETDQAPSPRPGMFERGWRCSKRPTC